MHTERIVATLMIRDDYQYVRFNYAVRIWMALLVILAISLVGNVAMMTGHDRYRYVMTDPTGKLLKLVPLSEPNMADDAVAKWAVDAVTRIYTFDFLNYRSQFGYAQQVLTGIGWDGFQKSMEESGNFRAVTENRYVTTAVPNGPAAVRVIGQVAGGDGSVRYVWQVTFPMLITYRSGTQNTSQDLLIHATVVRMPEFINYQGLGIRQIVAE